MIKRRIPHSHLGALKYIFNDYAEWLDNCKLGVVIEIAEVKQQYTSEQERGYWWLLGEWLRINPMPGVTKDDLHKWICGQHFGRIEREFPNGDIDWIPTRTTTRIWDHDVGKYKRKKLPIDGYSALIESTYRFAAEGHVVLPELETRRKMTG